MVVGWATADHMRASLVTDALKMARDRGHLAPDAIFHSDRGTQGVFNRSKQQLLLGLTLAGPRRLPLGCAILGRRAAGC
ncbi:hypothetical protein BJQ89_03503 [Arthrobacter sp. ES1]|nr:hypothetical protein [Arthrobacter sp. ES1]